MNSGGFRITSDSECFKDKGAEPCQRSTPLSFFGYLIVISGKNLEDYRISRMIPTFSERVSYTKAKKLSYEEFLELILSDEVERKRARALNLKRKKAGVTSLASYDWSTTTYDRNLVKKLFNLAFLEFRASVLIFGPTGKTYLSRHLAFSALKAGHNAVFVRANKMFEHLKLSIVDDTHGRALRYYLKPKLLVVDGP